MEATMRANERGIALLLCLLALVLLTGLGIGLLYMSDAETQVNSNYRGSQQAYFAATAGLQNVRERMTPANTGAHALTLPNLMPGNAGSVLYVTNPAGGSDTVAPTDSSNAYYDDELCKEFTTLGLSCAQIAGSATTAAENGPPYLNTSAAVPYKWVRVMIKSNGSSAPYYANSNVSASTQVCWDGTGQVPVTSLGIATCNSGGSGSNPPSQSPVYQLTSFASTPTGATRILQMEVAMDPPLTPHGAVDSQDHVALNGQLNVNAYDYCTCSCTTTTSHGQTTMTCTDRSGVSCDRSKYAIYASGTVDNPTPSENFFAGTSPVYVQNQAWPWDMSSLISRYTSATGTINVTGSPYNWSCTGGSCGTVSGSSLGVPPTLPPNPPSSPVGPANMASQVTYVPGSVQLTGNTQGSGVLVIDGDLDIHGGLSFYGLIIVRGDIKFTGGGSQGVNVYGGIIAGQESYMDNTLGGSASVYYDYCALPQPNRSQPPRVLASRDINF
jgi:Tfp pilus assembly protein PilX